MTNRGSELLAGHRGAPRGPPVAFIRAFTLHSTPPTAAARPPSRTTEPDPTNIEQCFLLISLLLRSSYSYCVAMAYSSIIRSLGSPANKRRPSYAQKAGRSLARRAPWQLPKEPQKWCQKTRPARAQLPYPLDTTG